MFFYHLKQGIGSVYVMDDFICKGYLELLGSPVELELQNNKYLPIVGFEPTAFHLRRSGAITELRGLNWMSVDGIKVHLVLTVLFFKIYL